MLRFSEFEALGLHAAFMSDVSDGNCATEEQADARRALCAAHDCDPESLTLLSQVHGTRAIPVTHETRNAVHAIQGDALITNAPGLPIAVRVADCVPVFLFDADKSAVAIVHAGREGTSAGITASTIKKMGEEFGTRPEDLHAIIGPSAGPCCYEVSQELADRFAELGYPTQGRCLDLWRANAIQMEHCGVPSANIMVTEICTICSGQFFSYRGGAAAERNIAVICL